MLNRLRRRPRSWPDEERWETWPVKARVLAVTRTLTSATRVLDVLTLLVRPQAGIKCYITVNPGSEFTAGLDTYLDDQQPGITVLPWEEAVRYEFDLAVACAVHASMHRLHAPLVVLPHGAGYNRLVTESTGDEVSAAGLSRNELTHRGRVFPAVIGLSHEEQFGRLRAWCPEALPRARDVGDLGFTRMLASLGRRDDYRAALGAIDGRRLVVVNSTWSKHSLAARSLDLPHRLIEQLPADEYTVAVILHPNIWAKHDPETLLATARRSGLRLIPPHQGWQAALVAADVLIGDHGSVSFYGSALDHPTLLVATGAAELDPHSPTYAFGQAAPALDPDGDLLAQLETAIAKYDPELLRPITDRSLGQRHRAVPELAPVLFDFLSKKIENLVAPEPLPPYPAPVPLAVEPPAAYDVEGESDGAEVSVRRFPIDPDGHARGVFVLSATVPTVELRSVAEVLARTEIHAERPAEHWLAEAAAELPGLLVAVAALGHDRGLLRLRTGELLEAHAERPYGGVQPGLDPLLLGGAVALWLAEGGDPGNLPEHGLTIRTGEHRTRVAFTPPPG
ncbi:hypothetical protein [Kitasatospora aureofaciens]|uniref:hypothetical protein n=1 Tax=Kitasatospora aureofaciens TaxID=1894 RepID=UPI001C45CE97|nr:hypothetical protein [Kitasatospora aureofaciens]MBV6698261.1 hypothetical protein [Kitasatospora aureofaciens]